MIDALGKLQMTKLHLKLVARQSDDELERKAIKAQQRGFWTQEDIDWAYRRAERLYQKLQDAKSRANE